MTIQYASDLHLEFLQNWDFLLQNKLVPRADLLVLAGDIHLFYKNIEKEKYFDILSNSFKQIYWLPGNHEYYNSDVIRYHKYQYKRVRPNIHVVNNQVVSLDGINLLFTTLWGKISPQKELFIKSHVSDFGSIRIDGEDFRPKHFNTLHQQCLTFLETEFINRKGQKNVVVTHHVPTLQNYPEEYKNSALNEAFVVDLTDFILKYQPEAWIYGHSHVNEPEFNIGQTRMLTNQLGYVEMGEHKAFRLDASLVI